MCVLSKDEAEREFLVEVYKNIDRLNRLSPYLWTLTRHNEVWMIIRISFAGKQKTADIVVQSENPGDISGVLIEALPEYYNIKRGPSFTFISEKSND